MKIHPVLTLPVALMPLALVERAARAIFARVLAAHPDLFERLGDYGSAHYCFLPSDLPLKFVVTPAARRLDVYRKSEAVVASATVEGPLFLLLSLLEGRCDADALFFSRDLTVEGDMEAMLALRNALDDSNIDLPSELAGLAGPFGPLVSRAALELRSRVLGGEGRAWN